jgi:glutamyl-tRNA reductase
MAVLALGISFRRAPIELLERLAFTDDDLVKAYRRVQDLDGVDEAVVLSTCNRVEIYGSVPTYHAGFLALKRLLAETRTVAEAELAEGLYAHWERDAVEHLFSVAGGLDSMVLGETQIQAQVREALRLAPDGAVPRGGACRATDPPGDVARGGAGRVRRTRGLARRAGAGRSGRSIGRGDRRRHDGLARREAPAAAACGTRSHPEPIAGARALARGTDQRGARRPRCAPRGAP